jgi:hypothetical protein
MCVMVFVWRCDVRRWRLFVEKGVHGNVQVGEGEALMNVTRGVLFFLLWRFLLV